LVIDGFTGIAMSTDTDHLLESITVVPDVLVGKPTIRGLRISVEQVLRALSTGVAQSEILNDDPELEAADLRAVLAYAAERVSEERVYSAAGPGD
jgi:uncharacterized protein (DUF433 family)